MSDLTDELERYKFNFWFFFILFIGFAASTIMLHAVTDRLQSELNASRLEFQRCSQELYVK